MQSFEEWGVKKISLNNSFLNFHQIYKSHFPVNVSW